MGIYVPIVMYGRRLFIVVLQLHCLRNIEHDVALVNNKKNKNNNNKMKNSENDNFNNFPVSQFWSFLEYPHILTIGTLL